MRKYKCHNCSFTFSDAEKNWDAAVDSGRCPKCREELHNFPVPIQKAGPITKQPYLKMPAKVIRFLWLVGLPTQAAFTGYRQSHDLGAALATGLFGLIFAVATYGLFVVAKLLVRKLRVRVDAKELPDQNKPQGMSSKFALSFIIPFLLASNAAAEWVPIGENDRFVAYADAQTIRRSNKLAVVWVLYDYKTVQESPRSGRKYLSEKGQREVDCQDERSRTIFFTWHAGSMGDGKVVYTGATPLNWEPNSPRSIAVNIWKFVCGKK